MVKEDFVLEEDSNSGYSFSKKTPYVYGKNKMVLKVISATYNCLIYWLLRIAGQFLRYILVNILTGMM